MQEKAFSLFLDTTSSNCLIGLLNNEYRWQSLVRSSGHISKQFHFLLQSLLSKFSLEIKDFSEIYAIVGPGSYTGIRLTETFLNVASLEHKNIFTFHSYRLPFLAPAIVKKNPFYFCYAFKSQYFVCWQKSPNLLEQEFLSLEELKARFLSQSQNEERQFFYEKLPENQILNSLKNFQVFSVEKFLLENSSLLFPLIKHHQLKDESFYFRPAEQEFSLKKE